MPHRIALANFPYPDSPEHSVLLAEQAIDEASQNRVGIICFPECFIPGYRGLGKKPPAPDKVFLEAAWSAISRAAAKANVAVILGTERVIDSKLLISALVIDRKGNTLGWQDKIQLDPSEDGIYSPGATERRLFEIDDFKFGIAICHEGFRYPETVRAAAREGAHCVFHPHYSIPEPGPKTFHDKAAYCRAAENTIFFATVNYATEDSPTTSAFINPDGTLLAQHPTVQQGLLIADLDISKATGALAHRYKPSPGA
ncbi:MAG: carbon-nitrogen hydrolase family protein [Bryobacteraceae bacterium]